MIFNKFRLLLVFIVIISTACNKSSNDSTSTSSTSTSTSEDSVVIEVDPKYFLAAGLTEPITKVSQSLADGSTVMCYKIV